MKLLFQRHNSPGKLHSAFSEYTKWKLKTGYCHGGVLIGDEVWHSTLSGGLHSEKFTKDKWDVFNTNVSDDEAFSRIKPFIGCKYDAFSLIAFEFPLQISDVVKLYCFEVQWLALVGESPTKPVTPDLLMAELLRRMNQNDMATEGTS